MIETLRIPLGGGAYVYRCQGAEEPPDIPGEDFCICCGEPGPEHCARPGEPCCDEPRPT